ncbi:MAG TPA: GtrA family protein [Mobilitalea sp.]|nr:GtrA family protein [Mobilitalea sp.]
MQRENYNNKFIELFQKIVNRETISYTIAGVLTTVVNLVSYEGLYRIGFSNLNANGLAWVIAVTFAYIVNKWTVFASKSHSLTEEIAKIVKFYGARVVTLGVEQLGMYIFVEQLGIYRWFVKAGLAVLVIILNYIFSKLYIFNKKNK